MEKAKKSKSFSEELLSIKDEISSLKDDSIVGHNEKIENIIIKFNETIKLYNGIRNLFLFIIASFVIVIFILTIQLSFNDKAEKLNKEIMQIHSDSISNIILGYKKRMNEDSTVTNYFTYTIRDNKIVTYNQLENERDSLDNLVTSKNDEIDLINRKINMLTNYYNISFREYTKNGSGYIDFDAPRVDSALILLEHFRDRLTYKPKEKSWYISQ